MNIKGKMKHFIPPFKTGYTLYFMIFNLILDGTGY